eukprot:scaffold94169_cov62-Attheya_sp.AAC.3
MIDNMEKAEHLVDQMESKILEVFNSVEGRNDDLADQAYDAVQTIHGVGTVKVLIVVQLAADMGLINEAAGLWGIVPKKNGKKSGTYKFMLKHYQCANEADANECFVDLFELIKLDVEKQFEKSKLEVSCCELGQYHRKNDIIFCDSNDSNRNAPLLNTSDIIDKKDLEPWVRNITDDYAGLPMK